MTFVAIATAGGRTELQSQGYNGYIVDTPSRVPDREIYGMGTNDRYASLPHSLRLPITGEDRHIGDTTVKAAAAI